MNRLCVTLALAGVLFASCVGNRARNDALLPNVRSAWPEVRVDFERGLSDGLADGDLTETEATSLRSEANVLSSALSSGDGVALVIVPYDSEIKPWASRGISAALEANEIGPNGATLLMERLSKFSAAILVLQERATSPLTTTSH